MATPSMQQRIQERYPDLVPLLRVPEIGSLLTQAVTNNWSPGVFQSKFRASKWFRTQPESQRRWWVLAATDPAEAKKQRQIYEQELRGIASQLGFTPTTAEFGIIRERALQLGVAPDSTWVRQTLINLATKRSGRTGPGMWSTTADQLRSASLNNWFKPLPDQVVLKWTKWIVAGEKTMDDFNQASRREAIARYPHMSDQLARGATVGEIVSPYIDAYAREMDWTADVALQHMKTDAGMTNLLGMKDPKTKKLRLPTEYEAKVMARQRSDWSSTTLGRQTYAGLGNSLLAAFGRRK